jgi:Uma2 family endonuclease
MATRPPIVRKPVRADLPTMYDLPSEDPKEPGLPDDFHYLQPQLLRETFRTTTYPPERVYVGTDINLYYDPLHTLWHKRPDWFAVLDVESPWELRDLRWSYVIWQEQVAPYLVVELLSPGTDKDDLGAGVRDAEEPPTKWEVYERILQVPYYLVYSRYDGELRLFELDEGHYRRLQLKQGRFWLPALGLGVGLWTGRFQGVWGTWLRWYDADGAWVPTGAEREEVAQQRAETAEQRAEEAEQRAARLAARLRELGIEPQDD